MNLLTIGADPELFLTDQRGAFISAIGKIGGSKQNPRQLERPGFALQEDNVAVEFNIPPASDIVAFVESIQWSVQRITDEVKDMGLLAAITPAAFFSEEELKHPRARHAGCDPDYNAWTKHMNPRPRVAAGTLRTAAGHVHIGSPDCFKGRREAFVKSLDLNLGVPSVLLDKDTLRKHLYGKAGAFRPTDYGLEYRVLSNFWLTSKELMEWVYTQTHSAYSMLEQKGEDFFNEIGEEIQACINTSDRAMSEQLLRRYNIGGV